MLTLGSSCIRTFTSADRNCEPSGRERFILQVDGVVMGLFEEYTLTGTTAVFRKGVLPPGDFVNDWRNFNRNNPLVTEEHDLTVLPLLASGNAGPASAELIASSVVDINGQPAHDRTDCLLVDDLTIRVGQVGAPSGVVTGFH